MLSTDNALAWGVEGAVKLARLKKFTAWKPGDKLKILLVGYNGKRNTGADVRVVEIVRQFTRVLGRDRIEITIPSLDPGMTRGYFGPEINLSRLSTIFFGDVLNLCSENHIAVISEGSTLKSQFANALTLYFCEAAGVMKEQGKPCIAYGSEAGRMDGFVMDLAARMCSETYFIARAKASLEIIEGMGLRGHVGTDTAWTFPPAPRAWAERELKEKTGWDGKAPILGIAVIDPWSYPVKPDLKRTLRSAVTGDWSNHYDKVYYFTASERDGKYPAYIKGLASAVNRFRKERKVHVVVVGMDATDFDACNDLGAALDPAAPVLSSRFYDGRQMASFLHALSILVTSRYHARVLSMTGSVPSIAVSLDERLYNLFDECGHLNDYYLRTDEPDLAEKLHPRLLKLWDNREGVSGEIRRALPRYLKQMSDMGRFFRSYVEKAFPGIELESEPSDWLGYIPELPENLKAALEGRK